MSRFAEIRNDYWRGPLFNTTGEGYGVISIDAWKTEGDDEEGYCVADVIITRHGEIVVSYHDNGVRFDKGIEEVIREAKQILFSRYWQSQKATRKISGYHKYQLQWMIDHDCSLQDLISELTGLQYGDPEDSNRISTPVSELFDDWEHNRGFDGMLWAHVAEWEESEGRSNDSSG